MNLADRLVDEGIRVPGDQARCPQCGGPLVFEAGAIWCRACEYEQRRSRKVPV